MAGKKLGNNPFKGGVDSLIRDTQDVQYTHNTQGRKGQKLPRINMAFQPEILEYLQVMSGFENTSITQLVNELIRDDMEKKSELYSHILKLKLNRDKLK